MIVNVFREEAGKARKERNISEISENDSVEIKKIKELLNSSNLDYISDNLRHILDIKKENKVNGFEKGNNVYRVIEADEIFRVILYIRLSIEDGDIIDGDVSKSIRNQLLYLLAECKSKNWNVVAIFCEEGISGADDNRPEWRKSLKFCECGRTEIFLCKSQSRFSRSMEMVEKFIHKEFVNWNIRFIGLVDCADTSVKGNKKTRQVNALVNEWQVEDQSINTRAILKAKKQNGLFTGSFAPYGYKKDPKDKYHLIIDEIASQTVKKIFELYSLGNGYSKIARELNNKKVPTPCGYKKIQGSKYYCSNSEANKRITYCVEESDTLENIAISFHSTPKAIIEYNNLKDDTINEGQNIIIPVQAVWCSDTIRKILMDEVYIGTLVQGKVEGISYKNKKQRKIPRKDWIRVPHCHNAIIDKDTWELVSERFKGRGRTKEELTGTVNIFSKKVYCACCGKVFQKNICHVKKGKQAYMQCKTKATTAGFMCKNNRAIRYDDLENILLNEINKQIEKYYDFTQIKKNYFEQKVENNIKKEMDSLIAEKSQLEKNILKKQKTLTFLYDDRVNGIITPSEFNYIKEQNNAEIQEYNKRIKLINEEIEEKERKKLKEANKEKIFEKYKKIKKLDRIILDEFINKIYIGILNPETKKRVFQIDWNIKAE